MRLLLLLLLLHAFDSNFVSFEILASYSYTTAPLRERLQRVILHFLAELPAYKISEELA